jgi:mRNA interferase RelE/StbE
MPDGYKIELGRSAKRELGAMRNPVLKRVLAALDALASDPRSPGCVKLSGHDTKYRVRAGDYRIIYEIDDAGRSVWVSRIRHRREVYD